MPRKKSPLRRSASITLCLYPSEMSANERAAQALGFRHVRDYMRHVAYAFASSLPAVVEGANSPQEAASRLMAINANLTASLMPPLLTSGTNGANALTARGREMMGTAHVEESGWRPETGRDSNYDELEADDKADALRREHKSRVLALASAPTVTPSEVKKSVKKSGKKHRR